MSLDPSPSAKELRRRVSKARGTPAISQPVDGQSLVFLAMLKQAGLPEPVPEHRFHPARDWRFDWCWPDKHMLALEIEGGAHTRGRHTRGVGFVKDMEKYSEAAALGWRLLRVTPAQLVTLSTLDLIRRALSYSDAVL